MVLDEGDVIQPKVIIVPTAENTNDGKIGQLKISGQKLYFWNGTTWALSSA